MVSAKIDIPQDTFLVGIGSSPGIAIGESFLLHRNRTTVVPRQITPEEVPGEVASFRRALKMSQVQLREVKDGVSDQRLVDHLYIIDTHLMILDDEMLVKDTISLIEKELLNAEAALQKTVRKFRDVFSSLEDEYLRDRQSDIDSVGDRILCNLTGETRQSLTDIDQKVVVIAHDLSPADTLQIDRKKIIGFVTDVGGRTSHTSILARSLGVPAVVGLETATALVPGGIPVIMDGTNGTLILNPSEMTFREYLRKKQDYEYQEQELLSYKELPAITRDGFRVSLQSNIELPMEISQALSQGTEGVGLMRSEFLFMGRPTPPDEEEQYHAYLEVVERMTPHPVTIRTLDVGGDKFVPEINLNDEMNPAMGLRGIRFSLNEKQMLNVQLRAILRASAQGPVRIMFPMLTGVAELRQCLEYLNAIKNELRTAGIKFDEKIPVGIMIETPAAALIADHLASEVDFFSIGTNDLIQYCLAVDRANEHVAYLYEPLHPAVLKALALICQAAEKNNIPVSMCGEMAGDPLYTLILLGLGINELSMNPSGLPRVKRILRQVDRSAGQKVIDEIFGLTTAQEVIQCLEKRMADLFPDLFGEPSF
ncbi:MAG: phosphoenolpyruvate--protein phosphotransferase [Desulfuromonas sp.]|nr:MAG: phosphoenolpyruvate--protein phosphotransferase [Desulfuromonas sp.]